MTNKLLLLWAAIVISADVSLAGSDFRSGYVEVSDGAKIHYATAGSGSDVLLIHGFYVDSKWNYIDNDIATKLAEKHRVILIDVRGHGKSDQPLDAGMYGDRLWKDCLEVLDHLKSQRTHIHGYSMGGGIVTKLVMNAPDRIISASYGGSGIPETEPKWKAALPADTEGSDPDDEKIWPTISTDRPASKVMMSDETTVAIVTENGGGLEALDLGTWDIPVLAITGEFDRPNAKSARMRRELGEFDQVVLPGKSHVSAVAAGFAPPEYAVSLLTFIDSVDRGD